jgi:UDP-3-O-[3-hydroxymyristoyl] glucosamine N-acyltransferase
MAGDARFFARTGPHALGILAEACGAAIGRGADRLFAGIAPLQAAGPDQVSFLDNRRYADALAASQAGAVILSPALAARAPEQAALLLSDKPYLAWAKLCAFFHPEPPPVPGIHPSAAVDPAARVGAGCEIGPFAVVEAGAEIGPGSRIGPHAVIGAGCVLGADCRIGAHASLSHAILGARVFIYPGARLGQPGFGFAPGPQGFVTVPQLGRVLVGDDVEVGANACIDRGSADDTVVGAGTRIDNLVQVAHNVKIGRACVIVSQVGLSGSSELGDFVQVGGQAGLTGHLKVGKGARIAAQAGVMTDVPDAAEFAGSPAEPIRTHIRGIMAVRRLASGGASGGGKAAPRDAERQPSTSG